MMNTHPDATIIGDRFRAHRSSRGHDHSNVCEKKPHGVCRVHRPAIRPGCGSKDSERPV